MIKQGLWLFRVSHAPDLPACELLDTLKAERLVLPQVAQPAAASRRAAVFVAIQEVLGNPPRKYSDKDCPTSSVEDGQLMVWGGDARLGRRDLAMAAGAQRA